MPINSFSHIRDWVFDLDHTLYPASSNLFVQLEIKMEAYLMRVLSMDLPAAKKLRGRYWKEHGTTLAGMILHHDTDPVDYLNDVQDIDFTCLIPNPALCAAITDLPGRKIVYTNGSSDYAAKAVQALGLESAFDALYGIDHAGYVSKPHRRAFEMVFNKISLSFNSAAMFEDDPRNLMIPHEMGLKTILVGSEKNAAHIHYSTNDLTSFLTKIAAAD